MGILPINANEYQGNPDTDNIGTDLSPAEFVNRLIPVLRRGFWSIFRLTDQKVFFYDLGGIATEWVCNTYGKVSSSLGDRDSQQGWGVPYE